MADLMLATLATGLQAGLYYAFSCSVMRGLHRGADRNFVATMQHINAAIINPWFLVTFWMRRCCPRLACRRCTSVAVARH